MENNRNKFFSISLYKDALKQLRIIGIVLVIIMGYMPFATRMIYSNYYVIVDKLQTIAYIVATFIIMLHIFGFTTKRNASDVVYSLPHTRNCIFISYVLAAITWIVGILFANYIGSLINYGKYKYVSYTNIRYVFENFVIVILIMGAISIAQGLTGMLFTNVAMSCVILFVPRILIMYTIDLIYSICPYYNIDYIKFPFCENLNLLTASFNYDYSYNFETSKGIAYTLILGLIYLVIGCILFSRRKSETAGNAAANKWIQGVVRTVVALVICLIPLYRIITYYLCGRNKYLNMSYVVICYVLAILVYYLFELLSTRKMRNLLKVTPGILFVVLGNIMIFGSVYGVTENIKEFKPNTDEVKYITISKSYYGYAYNTYAYINDKNYIYALAKDIKISDDNIINIFTDEYNKYVKNTSDYYDNVWSSAYEYNDLNVNFCMDGRIYHRTVRINSGKEDVILNYLCSDDRVTEKVYDLPDDENIIRIEATENYITNINVSKESAKLLYDSYVKELKEMSDNLKSIVTDDNSIAELEVKYKSPQGIKELYISITPLMPKTYKMFLDIAGQNEETYLDSLEVNIKNALQVGVSFDINTLVNGNMGNSVYIYSGMFDAEYADEQLETCVNEFLREVELSHKNPDINDVVYIIKIGSKTLVFSANEKCSELFNEMVKLNR